MGNDLKGERLVVCRQCENWGKHKCSRYRGKACAFRKYVTRPGACCLLALQDDVPKWTPEF